MAKLDNETHKKFKISVTNNRTLLKAKHPIQVWATFHI